MKRAPAQRNGWLAGVLAVVVFVMVGMAYAAVPLYDLFCQVTGYGGTTQRVAGADDRVVDREVVVRFDANVSGLPWEFRPEQPQIRVKLGETALVNYVAENRSTSTTIGAASFNVTPGPAGVFFNKIECFCFTEQALAPGEKVVMPVQFFVSADLAEEREMRGVRAITLSYTFFPVAKPGQPVAQAAGDEADKSM